MVANAKVNVSIIELVKTTEDEHHQEKIMGEDFPFFPSYKAGETIFLRTTVKGKPEESKMLEQYVIVDIHHSIHQLVKFELPLSETSSFVSMEVYVRKVV